MLEHIPDARAFARKLLESADTLIVSVPYRWRKGRVKHHPNDPVDERKMLDWFGREPTYSYICTEVQGGERRLICVFESREKWLSLTHRKTGRAPHREAPVMAGPAARPSLFASIKRRVARALGRGSHSVRTSSLQR